MVNTKRKPEETPKRNPGKSKFVFPKREAPPADNTYFDRLFSELQQQVPDSQAQVPAGGGAISEPLAPRIDTEEAEDSKALNIDQDGEAASSVAYYEASQPVDNTNQINQIPPAGSIKPLIAGPIETDLILVTDDARDGGSKATSSDRITEDSKTSFCKPETSDLVDNLKVKYRLSKGEANILRYLFGVTHDQGKDECYVTIPRIAEAVSLTTRGCQLSLKNLQTRGFVVRVEEYDPSSKLGIKLRVNLTPF